MISNQTLGMSKYGIMLQHRGEFFFLNLVEVSQIGNAIMLRSDRNTARVFFGGTGMKKCPRVLPKFFIRLKFW